MTNIRDNIIKYIDFNNTKYNFYEYPIFTADEEDNLKLDSAHLTSMIFHNENDYDNTKYSDNRLMIRFPKFHRNEKYELPINQYFIKKYTNIEIVCLKSTVEESIGGEGKKIQILHNIKETQCNFDKIYPLLNFEGKSWQHFVQDCLPILIFFHLSHSYTQITPLCLF